MKSVGKRARLDAAKVSAFALAAGLICISSQPAFAQSTDAAADESSSPAGMEEIVVTAERRASNLQDVPIAITAVTAEGLQRRGMTTTIDLPTLVPGLVATRSFSAGLPFLRGVGNITGSAGENPVAFYIDGIYLGSPSANVLSFNNIERIEVLKGPQGTLFGRNAVGGLIHVVTKDPTEKGTIDAQVGIGRFADVTGSFYGSTGVAAGLATNLAVYAERRFEGWGKNVATGNELFKQKTLGIQNKWRWENEGGDTRFLANFIYNYNWSQEGAATAIVEGTTTPGGAYGYEGRFKINRPGFDPYFRTRQMIGSLKFEHDFTWARISNLFGYSNTKNKFVIAPFAIPANVSAGAVANFQTNLGSGEAYSNELQLQSLRGSSIQWLLGAYYLHDIQRLDQTNYGGFSGVGNQPFLSQLVDGRVPLDSYAAYGQATATIFPKTQLTLGARYTIDKKRLDIENILLNAAGVVTAIQDENSFANAVPPVDPSKTWKKFTYRIALDHHLTDDVMIYTSHSTGFKGGVYSIANPANPAALPETLKSYAAGFKSELFDRHVRLNVEAFYMDYKNVQLRTTIPPSGTLFNYNAASARMKGVDVDFEVIPVTNFSLSGGFEYLHAYYRNYPVGPCKAPGPTGGFVNLPNCNFSGSRMIRAPEFTGNLTARLDVPLPSGDEFSASVTDSYNSGFFWTEDQLAEQKAYHNLTASIQWVSASKALSVTVWGKNLLNEDIWATGSITGPIATRHEGAPATYGVTLRFRR